MHMYKFALSCELLFTSTLNLVLSLINSITFVLCVQNFMASRRRGRPRMTPTQEEPTEFMDTMRKHAVVAH